MRSVAAQQTTRSEDAPMKPLNARQQRFVAAYARHWNGTQAAIEAGYSPRSARVTACRMLTKANIAAEVQAHRQQRDAVLDAEVQRIVNLYATIAFSMVCPLDYLVIQPDGVPTLRPVKEWTDEMRIMCEMARATAAGVKIVLRSRDRALQALARYTGGFEP